MTKRQNQKHAPQHPTHRLNAPVPGHHRQPQSCQVDCIAPASQRVQRQRLPFLQTLEHESIRQGIDDLPIQSPTIGIHQRDQRCDSRCHDQPPDRRPGGDRFIETGGKRRHPNDHRFDHRETGCHKPQQKQSGRKPSVQIGPEQKQRRNQPEHAALFFRISLKHHQQSCKAQQCDHLGPRPQKRQGHPEGQGTGKETVSPVAASRETRDQPGSCRHRSKKEDDPQGAEP